MGNVRSKLGNCFKNLKNIAILFISFYTASLVQFGQSHR